MWSLFLTTLNTVKKPQITKAACYAKDVARDRDKVGYTGGDVGTHTDRIYFYWDDKHR